MAHGRDHKLYYFDTRPLAAPTACMDIRAARRRELERGRPARDGNGTERK